MVKQQTVTYSGLQLFDSSLRYAFQAPHEEQFLFPTGLGCRRRPV